MAKIKMTFNDGSASVWDVQDVTQAYSRLANAFGNNPVSIDPPTVVERRPAPVVNKNDLGYLFQTKRDKLLDEIEQFSVHSQNGTLGDYSEIGFLATLMQILMED
jgi:hypothetical protein